MKANRLRASVMFIRKPTWIQCEKMKTTGYLQRYSPSILSTAQTEDRCLCSLHLPDLFYSSLFKLTYCSCLLRESEKRENLEGWSVSTTPGSPSQRATAGQHPGKCPLLMGDRCPHRRLLEATAFQGWSPPQTLQLPSHLPAVGDAEAHRRCTVRDRCRNYEPGRTSLGPACPGRRGHTAPGPKPLRSKEQASPEPGLNQGEGIKATQSALGKRHPQWAAQWGLHQGGQIQLSMSCK